MFWKRWIIVVCRKETKEIIRKRARQLDMSTSLYLKYLALKDIDKAEGKR